MNTPDQEPTDFQKVLVHLKTGKPKDCRYCGGKYWHRGDIIPINYIVGWEPIPDPSRGKRI